jgi:hypothetical protein
MEDLVDYIAIAVSFVAILVSLYTFKKTSFFNKYQQVDEMYMSILKIGIEHPVFRDASKTKNYEENFYDDEKIKYENYAYIVWNFCETLYDREFSEDETWKGALKYENDLHSDWFNKNSKNLYKEKFIKYIYKKFDYNKNTMEDR